MSSISLGCRGARRDRLVLRDVIRVGSRAIPRPPRRRRGVARARATSRRRPIRFSIRSGNRHRFATDHVRLDGPRATNGRYPAGPGPRGHARVSVLRENHDGAGRRWAQLQKGRNALVDPSLLVSLEARLATALARLREVRRHGALVKVPGDAGISAAIGPRVYIPEQYVDETGLVVFGSRAEYETLFKLPRACRAINSSRLQSPNVAGLDRIMHGQNPVLSRISLLSGQMFWRITCAESPRPTIRRRSDFEEVVRLDPTTLLRCCNWARAITKRGIMNRLQAGLRAFPKAMPTPMKPSSIWAWPLSMAAIWINLKARFGPCCPIAAH